MLTRFGSATACAWVLLWPAGCRPTEAQAPPRAVTASAEAGAEPATPTSAEGPDVPAVPQPSIDDPGTPPIDRARLLDAPTAYEHLTLRAGLPVGARYEDLVYEGNNRNFRGKPDAAGQYRSGDATALDWRRWIAGIAAMIVLRDSLFSQQDHPVLQAPRALMLPPNWVSLAVASTMRGETLVAPVVPALDDDSAWAELASAGERFGSFPPSERLFEESRRSLLEPEPDAGAHARTRNARASIRAVSVAAQAMVLAQVQGPSAVATAGAAWISASDRNYFGIELRERTIPIFVENPNEHEARDEGKGMGVWGNVLPPEAVVLARNVVYARRLLDGPLGVERYDLRHESERLRAITLLETLVPSGSSGHPVWLWVNGGSDGHGKGEPATPYIDAFSAALRAADVETSRVVLLSKPSARPKSKAWLDAVAGEARALGVPASIQLNTRRARRLIGEAPGVSSAGPGE
ncbi:MAG: hypothetical protein ACRBN8_02660 [Nannocystales bacterium]